MATLAEIDLEPVEKILDRIGKVGGNGGGVTPGDLIPLLQEIQETYGYLPQPVLEHVSRQTGIPASRMYGVITFYAQFYLEPHGKHTVRCCRGTACHVRGGKKVLVAIQNALGVGDGETTEDMQFSLETVACLGACALAPVMVIDNTYYGKITARQAEQIHKQVKEEG